jgi:hypothetical protein
MPLAGRRKTCSNHLGESKPEVVVAWWRIVSLDQCPDEKTRLNGRLLSTAQCCQYSCTLRDVAYQSRGFAFCTIRGTWGSNNHIPFASCLANPPLRKTVRTARQSNFVSSAIVTQVTGVSWRSFIQAKTRSAISIRRSFFGQKDGGR